MFATVFLLWLMFNITVAAVLVVIVAYERSLWGVGPQFSDQFLVAAHRDAVLLPYAVVLWILMAFVSLPVFVQLARRYLSRERVAKRRGKEASEVTPLLV